MGVTKVETNNEKKVKKNTKMRRNYQKSNKNEIKY